MRIKILRVKDSGRNINKADINSERNIVVIGENVVNNLFPNSEPLEKYIDIEGASFEVVGVLRNDDIFNTSEINTIYTPITA